MELVKSNNQQWYEEGQKVKARRLKHEWSMEKVGEKLGTSASRISRLEKGLPVNQAHNLIASYNLLFDYIELRKTLRAFFFDNGLNWRV